MVIELEWENYQLRLKVMTTECILGQSNEEITLTAVVVKGHIYVLEFVNC